MRSWAGGDQEGHLLSGPGLLSSLITAPSLLTSKPSEPAWLTLARRGAGWGTGVKARACLGTARGLRVPGRGRVGSGRQGCATRLRSTRTTEGSPVAPGPVPVLLGAQQARGPDPGPPGPPAAGSSGGRASTGAGRPGQLGEQEAAGLGGAAGAALLGDAPGAGAEAATGARGVRHRVGCCRAGVQRLAGGCGGPGRGGR